MKLLKNFLIATFFIFYATSINAAAVVQTVDGDEIALASLKGKWVFINYWASWCGPCLDEISELNHFYANNKNGNVAVFAVNYDALPLNKQQRLVRKFNIRYPSLKHNAAAAFHLDSISVVPVTFVFNPEGQLSTTLYGGQTVASLQEAMG